MKVKTFRAPTMKQALEEIKKELGQDAFILSGKEVKPKKVLGVFGKNYIEVTAAVDYDGQKNREDKHVNLKLDGLKDSVRLSEAAVRRGNGTKPPLNPVELNPTPAAPTPFPEAQMMLQEIRSLKSMIQSMPATVDRSRHSIASKPRQFSHSVCEEIYLELLSCGLDEGLCYELVSLTSGKNSHKSFPSKSNVKKKVASSLSRRIKASKDLLRERPAAGPQIIALIGPTGVGKTTTLAKLAARAVLEEVLEVGFITLDTFRIAAIEQLKTYAEIIGVPAKVVEDVSQMDAAIREFGSKDLILIDTAGRSQREIDAQWEMANYFSQHKNIHKSLVLSATTKESDLSELTSKYRIFGPNSMMVTKLDETRAYGAFINELIRTAMPLAYVTVGQNVPKDIIKPDSSKIVSLLLGSGAGGWESFLETTEPGRIARTTGQRNNFEMKMGAR